MARQRVLPINSLLLGYHEEQQACFLGSVSARYGMFLQLFFVSRSRFCERNQTTLRATTFDSRPEPPVLRVAANFGAFTARRQSAACELYCDLPPSERPPPPEWAVRVS